jgi:hypothetical protein
MQIIELPHYVIYSSHLSLFLPFSFQIFSSVTVRKYFDRPRFSFNIRGLITHTRRGEHQNVMSFCISVISKRHSFNRLTYNHVLQLSCDGTCRTTVIVAQVYFACGPVSTLVPPPDWNSSVGIIGYPLSYLIYFILSTWNMCDLCLFTWPGSGQYHNLSPRTPVMKYTGILCLLLYVQSDCESFLREMS